MKEFYKQLEESYSLLIDKMTDWLDSIILNLPNLVIAIIVGFIGYFLSKYVAKMAVKAVKRFSHNSTVHNLARNLSRAIFLLLVVFMMLTVLNLDSTINKILATAGVIGLAVGLALQDPMTNLFSGVMMSVRELYNIGDLIESNGHFGTILSIDLRSTKLRLPSGEDVVIPNKDVLQNPLKNFSSSGERRISLECGISYGDDLSQVQEIAKTAIASLTNVNDKKPIDFIYTSFGDSSINFQVRYWLLNPTLKEFLVEKSDGIMALKNAFDKNDIAIPFPIRTLDFGVKGGVNLQEAVPGLAIASKNG